MSFASNLNSINHSIPWQTAVAMVNNYNAIKPGILDGSYQSAPNTLLDYETFNLTAIQDVMNQTGCAGVRIYMGIDSSNEIRCIIVGVDAAGNDVIKSNGACALTLCEEEGQRFP